MKLRNVQYLTLLWVLLLLAGCGGPDTSVETEVQVGQSWQEAYASAIAGIEEQMEGLSPYAPSVAKGSLYDLNGDGMDELVILYPSGEEALSCALWTVSEGQLIRLAEGEIGSLAGAGAGGVNVVQLEGEPYFCAWVANSTPWDEERGLWYGDCLLWSYPKDLDEGPYLFPQHKFELRYFTGEGGSHIFSDAFSCVQNMAPLSFDRMISLKENFLDRPLERLCHSHEGVGMTLDELSVYLSLYE